MWVDIFSTFTWAVVLFSNGMGWIWWARVWFDLNAVLWFWWKMYMCECVSSFLRSYVLKVGKGDVSQCVLWWFVFLVGLLVQQWWLSFNMIVLFLHVCFLKVRNVTSTHSSCLIWSCYNNRYRPYGSVFCYEMKTSVMSWIQQITPSLSATF